MHTAVGCFVSFVLRKPLCFSQVQHCLLPSDLWGFKIILSACSIFEDFRFICWYVYLSYLINTENNFYFYYNTTRLSDLLLYQSHLYNAGLVMCHPLCEFREYTYHSVFLCKVHNSMWQLFFYCFFSSSSSLLFSTLCFAVLHYGVPMSK